MANYLQISRGVLAGRDAGLILSAKQCIEIGIQAIGRGFFYQAIEWMQTAVDKILYEEDVSVELQEAEMQLETSKIVVCWTTVKFLCFNESFNLKRIVDVARQGYGKGQRLGPLLLR